MISHNINPVLIDFGVLQIRYYGLFYVIGLIITYFFIRYYIQKYKKTIGFKLECEDILDYVLYIAIGIIGGARLGYFIFYEPLTLLKSPLELVMFWHGGMSFHGGFAGAIIGGLIFCKRKKLSFYKIADITVMPLALALAIGRIGNFINGELVGRQWSGFFCIDYSTNPHIINPPKGCRFPSQIVESLKNIFIFFTLIGINSYRHASKKKHLPDGSLLWTFALLYSLLRFFVEFIREPDSQLGFIIGWLTMGQILSIFMFLFCAVMLFFLFFKKKIKKNNQI